MGTKGSVFTMKKTNVLKLVLSALLMGVGYALPFLTGQVPQIGSMLLPLHLPALLCGFLCGWPWGLAVGLALPLTRSLLFGMPPLVPTALAMSVEMAVYGAAAGWLYARLPQKPWRAYAALGAAMLLGRAAWGLASWVLYAALMPSGFALSAFWAGAFAQAWPGMVLQVVLVPAVVLALERAADSSQGLKQ